MNQSRRKVQGSCTYIEVKSSRRGGAATRQWGREQKRRKEEDKKKRQIGARMSWRKASFMDHGVPVFSYSFTLVSSTNRVKSDYFQTLRAGSGRSTIPTYHVTTTSIQHGTRVGALADRPTQMLN